MVGLAATGRGFEATKGQGRIAGRDRGIYRVQVRSLAKVLSGFCFLLFFLVLAGLGLGAWAWAAWLGWAAELGCGLLSCWFWWAGLGWAGLGGWLAGRAGWVAGGWAGLGLGGLTGPAAWLACRAGWGLQSRMYAVTAYNVLGA